MTHKHISTYFYHLIGTEKSSLIVWNKTANVIASLFLSKKKKRKRRKKTYCCNRLFYKYFWRHREKMATKRRKKKKNSAIDLKYLKGLLCSRRSSHIQIISFFFFFVQTWMTNYESYCWIFWLIWRISLTKSLLVVVPYNVFCYCVRCCLILKFFARQ